MDTVQLEMTRKEARVLYRKYKEHRAYSEPIDWEIQRTYQLMAQGKTIIRAIESVRLGGLDHNFLPKLALAPATATHCHIQRQRTGAMTMRPDNNWWGRSNKNVTRFAEASFTFPLSSFPASWFDATKRADSSEHRARVPIIPLDLRPKRGLENYHILWEAEWERQPPRDPYLLRRIGKADLWLVVAHWDLTEVERGALATRIAG